MVLSNRYNWLFLFSFFQLQNIFSYGNINTERSVDKIRVFIEQKSDENYIEYMTFTGAQITSELLPEYYERISIENKNLKIINEIYAEVSADVLNYILKHNLQKSIQSEVKIKQLYTTYRGKSFLTVSFIPLRKNSSTGKIEQLVSFHFSESTNVNSSVNKLSNRLNNYASNSVLAVSNWYKFSVASSGVYKLTYEDLVSKNIPVNGVNSDNIKVYGNGGGMLPSLNSDFRYDD